MEACGLRRKEMKGKSNLDTKVEVRFEELSALAASTRIMDLGRRKSTVCRICYHKLRGVEEKEGSKMTPRFSA